MRAVVLGGGGLTGRCAVRDLARGGVFDSVVVADLDPNLAGEAARAAGAGASAVPIDVRDHTALGTAARRRVGRRERRPVYVQPRGDGGRPGGPGGLPRFRRAVPHDEAPARAGRGVPKGRAPRHPRPGAGAWDFERSRDAGVRGPGPGRFPRPTGRVARPHGRGARDLVLLVAQHVSRRDGPSRGRVRGRGVPRPPADERPGGVRLRPAGRPDPGSTARSTRNRRPCRRA